MDGMDATTAAYEVGYESVSQFSREYSRFFGQPQSETSRRFEMASLRQFTYVAFAFADFARDGIARRCSFYFAPNRRVIPATAVSG